MEVHVRWLILHKGRDPPRATKYGHIFVQAQYMLINLSKTAMSGLVLQKSVHIAMVTMKAAHNGATDGELRAEGLAEAEKVGLHGPKSFEGGKREVGAGNVIRHIEEACRCGWPQGGIVVEWVQDFKDYPADYVDFGFMGRSKDLGPDTYEGGGVNTELM